MGAGNLNCPKLQEIPFKVKLDSVEKRFIRFLKNEYIDMETLLHALRKSVAASLGLEELVLAIDGSAVGRERVILIEKAPGGETRENSFMRMKEHETLIVNSDKVELFRDLFT